MLKEIVLAALVSLSPSEKKAFNSLQSRLKKNGYDISQYVNDPRFGIYRFEKKGKKSVNYADTNQSWYMRADSLEKCADFIEENYHWLKKTQEKHGPSPEWLTSLFELETNRGQYTGEFPLIVAFASVYIDRPDRRNEFYKYMNDFLDLFSDTTDNIIFPKDIFEVKGSWAGAFGICQAMPDKIKKYGARADGDGDGLCNLMTLPDAAEFTGFFLDDLGFDENAARAIQRYNHVDKFYGSAITKHSNSLKKIMERRSRIPPMKINSLPELPQIYSKPEKYNVLMDMKPVAIQPPVKHTLFNRRIGKR